MKETEKRAYQAAVVKATIVKYLLQEAGEKLKKKSPDERTNSAKLLKNVIEQAMAEYSIEDLAPDKELTEKAFQKHVVALVNKVREKVEERLKTISKDTAGETQ